MLTVSDLMTLKPTVVSPNASLRMVVELMKSEGCRQLPVLDESGRLVGIITDRDVRLAMNSPIILHERWQDDSLLDMATAESCMTPDPLVVTPDTPAYLAAEILAAYKFGALPVVAAGELLGIISVTDFLNHFSASRAERNGRPAPVTAH
jgi:acetoin utilization protein AcuB